MPSLGGSTPYTSFLNPYHTSGYARVTADATITAGDTVTINTSLNAITPINFMYDYFRGMINPFTYRIKEDTKVLKTRCYSARTGLKRNLTSNDKSQIESLANRHYKGCKHCGWYSWVFWNHESAGYTVIGNNEDFEKVKEQFTNHMNRSHKDICKKKQMAYIEDVNRNKYK